MVPQTPAWIGGRDGSGSCNILELMKLWLLFVALAAPLSLTPADIAGSGKAIGVPSAPILMEVFSDYQCPACKVLHEQTLRPLAGDYVRPGKVYLVHRDFPLPMHTYSRQAAYYACAAARVGKYEQVADALFAKQADWSVSGKVDEAACSMLTPAEATKVRALVKDPVIAAEVQRDTEMGDKFRVNQTPTMIVTYHLRQYPMTGSVNYELLRRFLDDLLTK
jgi:protein-disulfide isomerase